MAIETVAETLDRAFAEFSGGEQPAGPSQSERHTAEPEAPDESIHGLLEQGLAEIETGAREAAALEET